MVSHREAVILYCEDSADYDWVAASVLHSNTTGKGVPGRFSKYFFAYSGIAGATDKTGDLLVRLFPVRAAAHFSHQRHIQLRHAAHQLGQLHLHKFELCLGHFEHQFIVYLHDLT